MPITPEQARELLYGDNRRGGRRQGRRDAMNATERRFLDEWIRPRVAAGQIDHWWFQDWTFRLAHDCRYTPDFVTQSNVGDYHAYEIKGTRKGGGPYIEEDARVKLRVFAERFGMSLDVAWRRKTGWALLEM